MRAARRTARKRTRDHPAAGASGSTRRCHLVESGNSQADTARVGTSGPAQKRSFPLLSATSTEFKDQLWILTRVREYVRRPRARCPAPRTQGVQQPSTYRSAYSDGVRERELPD